jgi:hypothetical protein
VQRTGQSLTKRAETINDRLTNTEEYGDFLKYIAYNSDTGEMIVDSKAAEEDFANSPESMEAFDTFVSELEDLTSGYAEDLDSLEEYADSLQEYLDSGREEYSDLLS